MIGSFQFQIGAIRGARSSSPAQLPKRFNSKLVRLEAKNVERGSIKTTPFQFQIGAIRGRADWYQLSAGGLVSIPNWCD